MLNSLLPCFNLLSQGRSGLIVACGGGVEIGPSGRLAAFHVGRAFLVGRTFATSSTTLVRSEAGCFTLDLALSKKSQSLI